MEHILTYTSYISDTNRQPDRRMRPQSAFTPSHSYFKQRDEDDDLGRPVLQHKPLAKGEFTQFSLAKVFEDDPGMRPKVFAPPSVNKVSYGLMSRDIEGAAPVNKSAPYRARDTDPNAPRYVLPGSSSILADAATAAVVAAAASDSVPDVPSAHHHHQQRCSQEQTKTQHAQAQPQQQHQQVQAQQDRLVAARDTLDVADINAVTSMSERPVRLETRHTLLATRDVEGAWPGWEPPFRAHVGKNLRDPGLDVSDISGNNNRRRRVMSARPTLGSRGGGGSSVIAREQQLYAAQETSQAREAVAAQEGRQQQPRGYLPPPLSCQPVYDDAGTWASSPNSNRMQVGEVPSSDGSSGVAARRHEHPVRQKSQSRSSQPQPQPPEQQQLEPTVVHAAGAWPTVVTLPLRPGISPPPYATHIPTGSVAAVLSASLDTAAASRMAAVADHPSVTVGQPTPGKRDPNARHCAKVALAAAQRADAAAAQRVISSLRPSREALEEFFSSCRRLDRETCGKVTPTDFIHALERSNLLGAAGSPGEAETGMAAAAAAAGELARGFQDGSGMVSYRQLARALLEKTRRSSPTARTTAAAVATAAVPSRAAPSKEGSSQEQSAASSAIATSSKCTLSRQVSDTASGSGRLATPTVAAATDGASAAAAGGGALAGASGNFEASMAADVLPGAGTGTQRRSVNWAPEPSPAGAGVVSTSNSVTPPSSPYSPQDMQRLERQERQQLRREEAARRRPYSAAPGEAPKSAGAVSAVFKLLGAHQPILYDTPAPGASAASAAAPVQPADTSSSTAATAAGGVSVAPAWTSAKPQPAAATGKYDGMGFGPHWPPEPLSCALQKRPTITIMENSGVQLRDMCDVTYFPYKGQALWFTGRTPPPSGPDGSEVPGGPAEAAQAYQPSVDPTSFIVGKGHHRVHIPPTGQKLEPEVEAALVARLRPRLPRGSSPEATSRARTASSVINQLKVDNPLLYPGNVDPTTPAAAALKGMLGCLYSIGSNGGASAAAASAGGGASGRTAGAAAARPATAGPRRSSHLRASSALNSMSSVPVAAGGGGGSGAARVGRAALERQMHREEVAAVRRLC